VRRRRIVVGVAASVVLVAICAAGAVGTSTGCTTHECDPSSFMLCPSECEFNDAGQVIGPSPCFFCNPATNPPPPIVFGGDVIDDNTWESNPFDGTWLNYNPNATIFVVFPPPFAYGRTPNDVEVFVGLPSDAKATNADMTQFTQASGELAVYTNLVGGALDDAGLPFGPPGGFTLLNGTCGVYVARVLVHFDPIDGGGSLDSGSSTSTVTDAMSVADSPGDGTPSGTILDAGGG
jgi:hypothetical protein